MKTAHYDESSNPNQLLKKKKKKEEILWFAQSKIQIKTKSNDSIQCLSLHNQ